MVQEVLDIIMKKDKGDADEADGWKADGDKCEPVDVTDTNSEVITNPANDDKGDSNLVDTNTIKCQPSEPHPMKLFTNKCKDFKLKSLPSKTQAHKSKPSTNKIAKSDEKKLKLLVIDYNVNSNIPNWFNRVVVINNTTCKVSLPRKMGIGNVGNSHKESKNETAAKACKPKKDPYITTTDGKEISLKYNTCSAAKKNAIDNVLKKWVKEDELESSQTIKKAGDSTKKNSITTKKSKSADQNNCTTSDAKTTGVTRLQ